MITLSDALLLRRQIVVIPDFHAPFSALLASRHKKRHSAHDLRQEKLALHRRRRGGRTQYDIYTIIKSCRRRGIDPYMYLRDVLTRLPFMSNWQIPEVTPEAWAKARRTTAPTRAEVDPVRWTSFGRN